MPNPSPQTPVTANAGRIAGTATGAGVIDSHPVFSPVTPAAPAVAQLLLAQFAIIENAEVGIRADNGAAVLHEYRVACRRSRTLAFRVKKVLPATELRRFKAAFAWLSGVTGPCRDLDVFMQYLEEIPRTDIDSEVGIADLQEMLRGDKRKARARMLRAMRSKRYQRFKSDWRALLERAANGHVEAPRAALPIRKAANKSIWRSYYRILKAGKIIMPHDAELDAEGIAAVHELRKEGKKLRYLLESFSSLYSGDELRGPIKSLRKLQDTLGGIVDAEVQALALQQLAARLDSHSGGPALRTVHLLLNDCNRREKACLNAFGRRYRKFTTRSRHRAFKQIFKHDKG